MQGGKVAAVYGYSRYDEYLGSAKGEMVNDADYVTFTLDQQSPVSYSTKL